MKRNTLIFILVLLLAISLACSPAQTPAPETVPPAQPTSESQYHPLDMLTNLPEIDVIIRAVASRDPQELQDLFGYTTIACMTVNALGGPPACREGEAEGTLVEVLPSLGPEGSFLRKDEAGNFPALNVTGLYAVYRVPESSYSDENYPAGDYAIAYLSDGNAPEVILQITDGKIVRIDYVFGYPESNDILPQGVTDFVLEPVAK